MIWWPVVIVFSFSATCRRKFERCRRRTLPSHRRLWPRTVCQWRQANFQNSTQCPTFLHFYILKYHVFTIHVLLHWVGIIVVVSGQTPHTLYLSGDSELEQPWWICLLLSHCYPSTCTCRIAALLDWSCPDQPYAYTYARLVATLDVWLVPYKWPWGCTFLQL